MAEFLEKNIEAQLKADADGTFKNKLIDVLNGYKSELEYHRQQLLRPDEHIIVEHLNRAVEAALSVISSCGPVKSGDSKNMKDGAFNSMMNV